MEQVQPDTKERTPSPRALADLSPSGAADLNLATAFARNTRVAISPQEAAAPQVSELLASHPGLNVALGLCLRDARAVLDHGA